MPVALLLFCGVVPPRTWRSSNGAPCLLTPDPPPIHILLFFLRLFPLVCPLSGSTRRRRWRGRRRSCTSGAPWPRSCTTCAWTRKCRRLSENSRGKKCPGAKIEAFCTALLLLLLLLLFFCVSRVLVGITCFSCGTGVFGPAGIPTVSRAASAQVEPFFLPRTEVF